MSDDYVYACSGRNRATFVAVAGIWLMLIGLTALIDLAPWLAGLGFLATLPAVYDLITARAAGLTMNDNEVSWYAGDKTGNVSWDKVDHVRFDTRLDLSVRASLVLHNYRRIKIPFEATPPHRDFEAELNTRGLRTERHHFGFM